MSLRDDRLPGGHLTTAGAAAPAVAGAQLHDVDDVELLAGEPARVFPRPRELPTQPWADPAYAREHWSDAAGLADAYLAELLMAATLVCAPYAPPLAVGGELTAAHRLAVVFHARDLHNARTAGYAPADGLYPTAEPRPLSLQVRQLLRPPRGPSVG